MKPSVRLENWYVFEGGFGTALFGNAFGHPRFEDGTAVRTSLVQFLYDGSPDNDVLAETMNTMYKLGKPMSDKELDRLKEALKK